MQQSVGGEDGEVFFQRLGDKEAVERIAVVQGEGFHSQNVVEPQRDEVDSIFAAFIAEIRDR